jgi:hypothetical protein
VPAPSSTGALRLALLIEHLLGDAAVQQQIAADPELQELWSDPAVRARAVPASAAASGLAALLNLASELVRDPAVQARIDDDPALRELWSRPDVRQRIPVPDPR